MGYRCTITSDSYINEDDIQKIVDKLPQHLRHPIGNSKQSWGWSCGCDVYLPERNKIDIGVHILFQDI